MQRDCTHCRRPYTRHDFIKEESKEMEAERKVLGLVGVRFFYYECSHCGQGDVFVDLHPMEGETAEHFHARREGLEAKARGLRAERIDVVITEKHAE